MVDESGVANDGVFEMDSDEVRSASVPSISKGLPLGKPSYQRHEYDDLETLVQYLD